VTTLRLGVRLAFTDRPRLVIAASAVSLAVAFLLGSLGALPARQARLDRVAARTAVSVPETSGVERATWMTGYTTYWRGRPVEIRRVATVGMGVAPPGLARLPAPGELAVSPDLARVLRGPHRHELTHRLPGHQSMTIAAGGLSGPRELFAYVGVQASELSQTPATLVTDFGVADRAKVPLAVRTAAWLGAAGLLIPILVLVAAATRLSTASRDRRLAALRLVGATRPQARQLAGGEAAVLGALGVLGGLLGLLALRSSALRPFPQPEGVFPADLWPTTPWVVAVFLGVPTLCVASGIFVVHHVLASPLHARREARIRRSGWLLFLPLTGGLAALVAFRATQDIRAGDTPLGLTLLVGGAALTAAGLATAAPVASRVAGAALERLGSGLASTLAARRIAADPTASARVVTGAVLVVFVAGWGLAYLPVKTSAQGGYAVGRLAAHTPPGTILAWASGAVDLTRVRAVPGVHAVALLERVAIGVPAVAGRSFDVDVGSCDELDRVLLPDLGCDGSSAYLLPAFRPGSSGGGDAAPNLPSLSRAFLRGRDGHSLGPVALPSTLRPLARSAASGIRVLASSGILVERATLPTRKAYPAMALTVLVATDGSASTVEAARDVLSSSGLVHAETLDETLERIGAGYLGYRSVVQAGLVIALVVAAASLAVTVADFIRERRRGIAALVAIGTPLRVIRRMLLLQMGAPLLVNVLLALLAAILASVLSLRVGTDLGWRFSELPWAGWLLTVGAAVVAVLLATAATLPMVSAAGRPESLRTE
jgi:hypothetical protein